MNEYDSEKMADVLHAAQGMEKTDNPADADVILFNTCSVREKAQEKVFHDLGRVRYLKKNNPDLLIGVGGCVASQEGAEIVKRAPYVDLVFGPQTLHRLPQLISARRGHRPPAGGYFFSRNRKIRPSAAGAYRRDVPLLFRSWRGAANIAAFAWFPIRAARKFRVHSSDVLAEIAGLASQGVKEVTLLGQNVNAYRGTMKLWGRG